MNVALSGCAGLIGGALFGAAIGVGLGLWWTWFFQTTGFEGYSGMLVFFTFMPIGAIVGGLAGAITLGYVASKASLKR